MSYRDISYCATSVNQCKNKHCYRHLETEDNYYSLKHNKDNIPISLSDFSSRCDHYFKEANYVSV